VTVGRLRLSDHDTDLAQVGDQRPAVVLVYAPELTWQMWDR
jgi:hypothetical protein